MKRIGQAHQNLKVGQTVYTSYPDMQQSSKPHVIECIRRESDSSQSGCLVKLNAFDSWLDTWWIFVDFTV